MKKYYAFIVIFLVFLVFISISCSYSYYDSPKISKGFIDLSGLDFKESAPVKLDGEWEFYWNKLLEPADIDSDSLLSGQKQFLNIPGYWNKSNYPSFGCATYKLVIKTKNENSLLAMRLPRVLSAYKLWINGKMLASRGEVSKDSAGSKDLSAPLTFVFYNDSNILEIVMQVSNFSDKNGGFTASMYLGDEKKILEAEDNQLILDMFLLGLIFIMGFYHFIVYIFHRKEISALLLAITCLIMEIRIITTGEAVLLQTGIISEIVLFKINYTLYGVAATAVVTFFYTLFPKEFPKKAIRLFQIFNLASALLMLCIGAATPVAFINFYLFAGVAQGVYTIYILILAHLHKREGASILLLGTTIFLLLILNDVLRSVQIIYTIVLSPVGLATLMFAQSVVLAMKSSQAAKKEMINAHLMETTKLSAMRVLIGGIAHNLKTPVMTVSLVKDELLGLVHEYSRAIDDQSYTSQDHREMASEMRSCVEGLTPTLEYVNKIIDTLKNQAVVLNTDFSGAFTVPELFENIKVLSEHEVNRNNCRLKTEAATNIKITGQLNSLLQVIYNLIVNAIHAYNGNGGTIELKAVQEGECVIFSVKDYGKGISKKIQQKLFKEMITDKGKNGTGFGLYISYSVIKSSFMGDMWFETKEDKGTTFFVKIPVKDTVSE
ncbi:MAG: ATP-binding protein [Clostridia bacterium]|nr:ATP-binding protein [Clostridia bacterium]